MEKERFTHYTASDFVLDDDFVAWVQNNDPQLARGWELWLSEHPEKKEEVEIARQILLSLSFKTETLEDPVLDQEWQLIRENINESSAYSLKYQSLSTGRLFPIWARLLAASVALLLMVWLGKNYLSLAGYTEPELAEKRALNGQQLTVKLKDGTIVILNAGSTLRYPEHFPNESRKVQLTGEAYFEVAPNPQAPFLIFTEDVRVQVIGTKFIVKAYPENKVIKVAVVEGKVSVHPANQAEGQEGSSKEQDIFLIRDQMATIGKDDHEVSVTAYDKNDLLGWKNGVLYFEKADFNQFVNRLERWYGVQISVDEGVAMDSAWRFSGKFENKSIDYILDVCRYPNRFTYELSENKVFIKKTN